LMQTILFGTTKSTIFCEIDSIRLFRGPSGQERAQIP
jgi:hypothetical protein